MRRKSNLLLIMLAAACVVSVAVMIAVLSAPVERTRGEFIPPDFDRSAVSGTPDVPEGLGWNELDAREFRAAVCGVVQVRDGRADIWLTNPQDNTVWLKLRVLDENGNILGQTGLIRPGEYVQSVVFDTEPAPGAKIALKLMAYEPETYYSAGAATLNTTAS